MSETLSTFRAPPLLSPRTANYVAALIRQGDNFDYYKWLQRVREEEAEAKQAEAAFTSGETDRCGNRPSDRCTGLPGHGQTAALMTRTAPVTGRYGDHITNPKAKRQKST